MISGTNSRINLVILVFALLAINWEGCVAHHKETPPPAEVANIAFNFQNMPVMQVLDVYGGYAGKHVSFAPGTPLSGAVHLITDHRVTRTEAMHLIERALKEQANITIISQADGSLLAVRAARE